MGQQEWATQLALVTDQLSVVVATLLKGEDWRPSSAEEEMEEEEPVRAPEAETTTATVTVSALGRVTTKVAVRREELALRKTTGGADERKRERFFRSTVDIFRLRRECVSGNSIEELISDYKSMEKEALNIQLDRDYVQLNLRHAAKAKTSETLGKMRAAVVAREARMQQTQEKHKEVEREKAEMRRLSLSRDPVARQTVAAFRALPVSVISSSQAAASPLLNKDAGRRWSAVLCAGTFAAELGAAAGTLVGKRQREVSWRRFHLVARQVCCIVHWRHRTQRAKRAVKAWMFAVRCMRPLRNFWRRRKEMRSAQMVKTIVINALNAGKARFAIRRFLHSTRRIQTAWRDYVILMERTVRRWNAGFQDAEYTYLAGVFKEGRQLLLETKDITLQENIHKLHGERAARVLSLDQESEPSTPRNQEHASLPAGAAGKRRKAIRGDGKSGGSAAHEWAVAQTHRHVETHRLKDATRFAILAGEFHNRMRARAEGRLTLIHAFETFAARLGEFHDFLSFFGMKPEKADRSTLAAIKSEYENTVAELKKVGAISSLSEFPDIMNVVMSAHRNYGTIVVPEIPQPKQEERRSSSSALPVQVPEAAEKN